MSDTIFSYVEEVGAALSALDGNDWELYIPHQENPNYAALRGPVVEGGGFEFPLTLDFFHDTYRKKVRITGGYPNEARDLYISDDERSPSINVAPGRDPEAVARDIVRRLIPAYEERLPPILERVGGRLEFEEAKKGLGEHFEELTGWRLRGDDMSGSGTGSHVALRFSDDTIRMEISDATPEQAEEILRILGAIE